MTTSIPSAADSRHMLRALELAERGRGGAEPNPLVGCVIEKDGQVVGEGFHARYGGAHAEIEALSQAGTKARGSTLYVTLEPCCHYGQTPPCIEAIIPAGISRVVAAMRDPFPKVAGKGIAALQEAGLQVEVGLHEDLARVLNAPYLKLLGTGRPWIIAKWAMTLDGKIATRGGYSKWISGEASRAVVHDLRGRMDAIIVGRRTAEMDDPLLTARPPEGILVPRVALRIVTSSLARLPLGCQLVKTARQIPTMVACGPDADAKDTRRLRDAGVEVVSLAAATGYERTLQLLDELGRRRLTNVLVEGGSRLLGTLLDARQVDEVHVFVAPKLFGGEQAPSPVGGAGVELVSQSLSLGNLQSQTLGSDLYLHGRVVQPTA